VSNEADDLVLYRVPKFASSKERLIVRVALTLAILFCGLGEFGPRNELPGLILVLTDLFLCAFLDARKISRSISRAKKCFKASCQSNGNSQ
jgi:hypothetical protein